MKVGIGKCANLSPSTLWPYYVVFSFFFGDFQPLQFRVDKVALHLLVWSGVRQQSRAKAGTVIIIVNGDMLYYITRMLTKEF